MRSPETCGSRRGVSQALVTCVAAVLLVLATSPVLADQVVYFVKGKAIIVKSVERGVKFTVLELEGGGKVGVPTEQIERIEAYQEAAATAQAPMVPVPGVPGMTATVPVVMPGAPPGAAALTQPSIPSGTMPVIPAGPGGRINAPANGIAGLRPPSLGVERPGPAFVTARAGQFGPGGPSFGGPGRSLGAGMAGGAGARRGRMRPVARTPGMGQQGGAPGIQAPAASTSQSTSPPTPSTAAAQGQPAQNQAASPQSQASPPAQNSEPNSADSEESDADAYASGDDGEPADNASP